MAGPGQPLAATDQEHALGKQILADRFEVVTEPLGWSCRFCDAEVRAPQSNRSDPPAVDMTVVNRLAESAADHGLYCGRCDD